jgi:hypothetical protein
MGDLAAEGDDAAVVSHSWMALMTLPPDATRGSAPAAVATLDGGGSGGGEAGGGAAAEFVAVGYGSGVYCPVPVPVASGASVRLVRAASGTGGTSGSSSANADIALDTAAAQVGGDEAGGATVAVRYGEYGRGVHCSLEAASGSSTRLDLAADSGGSHGLLLARKVHGPSVDMREPACDGDEAWRRQPDGASSCGAAAAVAHASLFWWLERISATELR